MVSEGEPLTDITILRQVQFVMKGDVIDASAKRIIATLEDETGKQVQSEKLLEVDFAGGKPIRAGDQFAIGQKP